MATKSNGAHLYFAWDNARPVRNRVAVLPGLDVRGAKGFVRAGGVYRPVNASPIADAPEWLYELIKPAAGIVDAATVSAVAIGPEHPEWEYRLDHARQYLAGARPCVSGKGGQKQLWEIALRLSRTYELPVATSCELFQPYNAKCEPPWAPHEYERAFVRAAEHGTGVTGMPSKDNPLFQPALAKCGTRTDANDTTLAQLESTIQNEHPKASFERGDHAELAEELIRTHGSRLVSTEGAVWSYDSARGVWVEDGIENALRTRVVKFANMPSGPKGTPLRVDKHTVDGTLSIVKLLTDQKDFFAEAPPGLACANGFVTLKGIAPHAEENRARTFYPLAFDAEERSGAWGRFLHSLFQEDEDEAEKMACLQEFFGGALFGLSTRYQEMRHRHRLRLQR